MTELYTYCFKKSIGDDMVNKLEEIKSLLDHAELVSFFKKESSTVLGDIGDRMCFIFDKLVEASEEEHLEFATMEDTVEYRLKLECINTLMEKFTLDELLQLESIANISKSDLKSPV